MSKVQVSVIVPTLNEEKCIGACLRAIDRQETSLDYEIIVADSMSQDRTGEIARKYADRLVSVETKGIAIGRNSGAKAAKGSLLIFIDADTLIPLNYVDAVHAVMRNRGIAGLSCAFKFDKNSRTINAMQELSNKYLLMKGSFGAGEILGFNNAVHRDTFDKARGFPLGVPLEDGAFARRLRKIGRVIYLPEPVVTTSARRLENGKELRTILYYANLSLVTSFPHNPFRGLLKYRQYLPIR